MAPSEVQMEHMPDLNSSGSAGPTIGIIRCAHPYLHEIDIRRTLRSLNIDTAKEDAARLQGVQLIDDVRNSLQLLVFKTPGNRNISSSIIHLSDMS